MKYLKEICFIFAFLLLNLVSTTTVKAGGEFISDSIVTYQVDENGKTEVTHDIYVENVFSTLYATSYTLTLEGIQASDVKAFGDNGVEYQTELQVNGDITLLKVLFTDSIVGKGKKRHFLVSYNNNNFATRTGEVWEVNIPKLASSDTFRNYTAILKVPTALGYEAYISPRPIRSQESEVVRTYEFSKDELIKTGVSAGFGQFQVFTFTLNYHLENPLSRKAETEIALPPDTAFQKVYLESLNPAPTTVRIDEDGNWLAVYTLSSRQRVDVVATGEVQIFSSNRPFPKPTQEILNSNLAETAFWQVNDAEIKALALKLKTPKEIYNYVSTHLNYDYDRVRPNVDRLGAKGALLSPQTAICMEFTDLFVAIARAAGIPAREVNGYAYTENPEIQPLGLVADVLHAWPEYWDSERGAWIPIDPTWASTTGGVDFFDKLDLRHFSFVNHGTSDTKPFPPGSYKLGANPQKDVFVSFGKLRQDQSNYPNITATFKQGFPFLGSSLIINVKNTGASAFYGLDPTVIFENKEFYKGYIEVLPPYAESHVTVPIPYSFLAKDIPTQIKVVVDGSEVSVPTNKNREIITSLVGIFVLFIIILIAIIIRMRWTKKLLNPFQKVVEFISSKIGRR